MAGQPSKRKRKKIRLHRRDVSCCDSWAQWNTNHMSHHIAAWRSTFNCANYRSVSITINECLGGQNEIKIYINRTQLVFTCSNWIIETLEKDMKYKGTRVMSIMSWRCLYCWLWKIVFFIYTLFWCFYCWMWTKK